jgi:hypothetical protein
MYSQDRQKLEHLLKNHPFNTDKIKSFLDNIVFRKIPLLKKTFDDENKKKLNNRKNGLTKITFKKKVNNGDQTFSYLSSKTKYEFMKKIDPLPRADTLRSSSVNLKKVSDVLYSKTQRATFGKFLDCVRTGGISGSLNNFYS